MKVQEINGKPFLVICTIDGTCYKIPLQELDHIEDAETIEEFNEEDLNTVVL